MPAESKHCSVGNPSSTCFILRRYSWKGQTACLSQAQHGVRAALFEGFLHFKIPSLLELAHVGGKVCPRSAVWFIRKTKSALSTT